MRRLVGILSLAAVLALAGCSLAEDITPPPGLPTGPVRPASVGEPTPALPDSAPDLASGAAIYADRCSPCHGPSGLGDGEQSARLPVPPAALGDPTTARAASLADWYRMVTLGNLDRFMPGFQSLSDQQRLDVAAYALTLSDSPDELERGPEVYEENGCADCHAAGGPALGLTAITLAERSGDEIFQSITDGVEEMPAFGETLSEDERWALVSYLRASGIAGLATSAPSATPAPIESESATAEPGAATGTGVAAISSPTPAASATPEAPAGVVRGLVTNGTQGGSVEAGLEVVLRGVEGSQEVLSATAQVQDGGEFAFEDLDIVPGRLFTVSVTYQGVTYETDPAHLVAEAPVLELPLTVYETTSDALGLSIAQLHLILSAPEGGFVRIFEIWVFSNSGDRAVLPEAGAPLLAVALPEGAVMVQSTGGEIVGESAEPADALLFSLGVPPGVGSAQLAVAFDTPFDRRLELSQPVEYTIDSVILLAEAAALRPRGQEWSDLGAVDFAGVPVQQFSTEAPGVGETIDLTMVESTAGSSSDNLVGVGIGAAVLVAAVILAGLWWYRRREVPMVEGAPSAPAVAEDREAILRAIAALDDDFDAGKLDEEEYRARRQALKERALDQFRGGRD